MEIFSEGSILVKRIITRPYDNNVYILLDKPTNQAVVIDAANEAQRILKDIGTTTVQYLLQTHCHIDHVMALQEVREATGAPLAIHPDEPGANKYKPDLWLKDNQELTFGNTHLRVLHTPGHTPGGVCIWLGSILFSGDTLFPGGPGKTGSPDDFNLIIKSIVSKIYTLPEDIVLYPGHGESITIGESKKEYQLFVNKNKGPELYGDVLWLS